MFYIDRYPALVPPLIIFLLAFFLGLNGTWLVRRVAARIGLLDHPDARKKQLEPVPSGGGLAVVFAVVFSLLLTYGRSPEVRTILAVGVGIALVGLLDDLFSVRAPLKLLALAVGCAVLMMGGIGLNRTPYVAVNYALTFLWIAGVSSAMNAIDNADGLAGSVTLISASALFFMGWNTWQLCFSFIAMSLAGGILGFLHFNFKPARIYMGDTGSFFLGYILSVLVLYAQWSESGTRSFLAGSLVISLPVLDLGITTVLRLRHGVVRHLGDILSYSDRDHLSHRLLRMGLTHRQMLLVLCAANTAGCLLAHLVVHATWTVSLSALAAAGILVTALTVYLDRATSTPGLWMSPAQRRQKE